MKILVTGATGFVGRAIVTELLQEGNEVYCLGSLKSKIKTGLPNFFRADIKKLENLKILEKIGNVDAIIHSAGLAHQFGKIKEADFWKINVEGAKNTALLAVKLNARHFILISTVAVYGKMKFENQSANENKNAQFINEDCPCRPESVYAQSKLEGEIAAREICENKKIPLTILRLATVIGEGDQGNVMRLIKSVDKNRFLQIGSGENYKSLIYKGDVARACRILLNKKSKKTEVFNLTATPLKMNEIINGITLGLNKKIPKYSIPASAIKKVFQISAIFYHFEKFVKLSETFEKWISDEIFSGDKIKREYGFYTETTINEAIAREVKYYKNRK